MDMNINLKSTLNKFAKLSNNTNGNYALLLFSYQ